MSESLLNTLTHSPVELSFGTSGLRGLASDMTDLECYINTRGFINFLLKKDDLKPGSAIALAGDLRDSTSRILGAVARSIIDSGCTVVYIGKIPTPAAAYYGLRHDVPVAMVTGSHIPSDRNGIKFYKRQGEVLKEDELAIKQTVAKAREEIYSQPYEKSQFNDAGSLKQALTLPKPESIAAQDFLERYASLFSSKPLKNKKIVVYQHSSLAAEMLVELVRSLGATAIPVDKSHKFIPIDTENVTAENQAYFKALAAKFPDCFAIISADGDADRPFVVDETGTFHRGDVLGAITAEFLKAELAVVPVSASDAIDVYLKNLGIKLVHTKIGSPYVIAAMNEAINSGVLSVVGWEVNGGFLTGSDIQVGKQILQALPTRDAFLPIVCALLEATQKNCKLSEVFAALPQRFTQAGLFDNFPISTSQAILNNYSRDSQDNRQHLEEFFKSENGFTKVVSINSLDGIRITFDNNDIAHIRPSGNAPQLRIYSVSDSQNRADEIVALALAEPSGILRQLERSISH